jgi:serine/threonine-protein kinase
MILFGQAEGIMRVSATGGTPELVIRAEKGETIDGPQLLPDGESVLFTVTTANGATRWNQAQVVVQSLRTGARTVVLRGGSDARYVTTGHLVYALEDGLFAVAFDADRLEVEGAAVPLVEGLIRAGGGGFPTSSANYGVSRQGTLVYLAGAAIQSLPRTLVWVDREGREEALPVPPRSYLYPRLSPDGTRIAVSIFDQQDDIWVWHLTRRTLTRVTFSPGADQYPVWTPDGRRLLFGSDVPGSGVQNVFWQAADGTGTPERLSESSDIHQPYSISPDGSRVVLREGPPPYNLAVLLLGAGRRTEPLIRTAFDELNADISPDGRWMAYESDESGQREIYVRPFPVVNAGKWQVSSGGGTRPAWARNGQELFYMAIGGVEAALMTVRVEPAATWTASSPTKLFAGRFLYNASAGARGQGRTFDVAQDGRRFLMVKDGSDGLSSDVPRARFVVVENWFEELKRLVPSN